MLNGNQEMIFQQYLIVSAAISWFLALSASKDSIICVPKILKVLPLNILLLFASIW